MKRFHLLLLVCLIGSAYAAVGYSDSHVIKKESIQQHQEISVFAINSIPSVAEVSFEVIVPTPDLGSPASNYVMVSEELTGVIKMRTRPPPEKVQKSEYNVKKAGTTRLFLFLWDQVVK